MKFLHTADLHLNALRSRFPHRYLRRHSWTINRITDIAIEHAVDCIVVAGDLWEQPNLTNSERQLLSNWLGTCDIPIVMISGNHDQRSSRHIGDTCLSYISSLDLAQHTVHDGDPTVLERFGAAFLLMPFQGWNHREFRLIVQTLVENTRKNFDGPIIGVTHEAVVGSVTHSGIEIPAKIRITPDLGVDYWALGDIHLRQAMLPNAWYSGSPHQVKFDESPDNGVLIVDTSDCSNPLYIPIEHPQPLVTWDHYDPEKPLPDFLKLRPEEELAPGTKLPDGVIYERPKRDYIPATELIGHADPLERLPVLLRQDGLSEDLVELAVKEGYRIYEDELRESINGPG